METGICQDNERENVLFPIPSPGQLEECRAALSACEESRDVLRREVLESERRLCQTRDSGEGHRRDAVELRRSLGDVTRERDTLSQSNSQLREALRSAESERIR